jgi:hypothetical protein
MEQLSCTQKGSPYLLSQKTPEGRWATFGPYYAMFPVDFALEVISNYSNAGDFVLDPFSGRGTTIFASSMLSRQGVGIDINPLGWLYTAVKINPANKKDVLRRLYEIDSLAKEVYANSHQEYDDFFNTCYSSTVLNFLIAARNELDWKTNKVDRTLMGFLVVHLHGKRGISLSNQMQSVKACGPNYALKWWREKDLVAPDVIAAELISNKIEWRYAKGQTQFKNTKIHLGDSIECLSKQSVRENKYSLLLTSPPYSGVTDYFYDQWLRLWLLGGASKQQRMQDKNKNSFSNKNHYENLIYNVFKKAKESLTDTASVYVRTDARNFTRKTTIDILYKIFPEKNMEIVYRPYTKRTQTVLHGDNRVKPGEVDIILTA